MNSLVSKGGVFLGVVCANMLFWWLWSKEVSREEVTNLYYLLGLMLIFVGYVIIL